MPEPYLHQALQVFKHSDMDAELRITTDDESASLLWAAQWLDEHREYAVTGIRLDQSSDLNDDDAPATTTLVVTLDLANEPAPAQLGPWFHGVPPVPL